MESKGGAEFGLNLQPGQTGSWQTVLPFAWSNGASLTNEEGTEYTIDRPEMAEALDYYTSYFEEGLSETRLLDPGELESGFADGHLRLLHLRPVAHRPGRGRRRHPGASTPSRRCPARTAAPGTLLRRRWRPGRLQRLRQRRQRLEVRPVAERAGDPAGVLRRGRRPAGRASRPGRAASSPRTRSCRSSASSSRGRVPAGRPHLGAGRGRDRRASSSRHPRAACPPTRPWPRCSPRPRRSAPGSDRALDHPTTTPGSSQGAGTPAQARGPHAAAAGCRRVGPGPAVHGAVPGLHGRAGAGQPRHELHRHAQHRRPQPARRRVRRARELLGAARRPAVPQGHAQHRCSTWCSACR